MPTALAQIEPPRVARQAPPHDVDAAMSRYAHGDDGAFAQVYGFVAPRLTTYLRRRVRDDARVPDLVQQIFLNVHRARRTFIDGAEVLPWAFAIARRQLVEAFRSASREPATAPHVDEPACLAIGADELLAAKEAVRRVEVALARLSRPQRAAFELVKGEGLSLAQAAVVLGTTVTGVKLRTHRAYAALRLALVPSSDG